MMAAEGGVWSVVGCSATRSRVVCQTMTKSSGSPVALGFLILVLVALLSAVGFIVYKKTRPRFTSTIRYERTFDESDTHSIITEE